VTLKTIWQLLFDTASPSRAFGDRLRYRLGLGEAPRRLQWTRKVMYQEITKALSGLDLKSMHVLEISPGDYWQRLGFGSYQAVEFSSFDICSAVHPDRFDLIIADQVFEHVLWPYRAARNTRSMLKDGGRLVVTTPFLIRIHEDPVDCSRWTETGLRHLLAEAGFDLNKIQTGSWGNRSCVKANLKRSGWASLGRTSSLRNDPTFPCVVWAIASK